MKFHSTHLDFNNGRVTRRSCPHKHVYVVVEYDIYDHCYIHSAYMSKELANQVKKGLSDKYFTKTFHVLKFGVRR